MKNMNEIEEYAIENNVPIIDKESLNYIIKLISERNILSILELGSAIGYSAINFALVNEEIEITTIERDTIRYNKALENIKKFKLNKRIEIIHDDIFNVDISKKYDMIFIDAAKSQNKKFLNIFKNNLNDNGIIIIDNLGFHGLVGNSNEIKSKNLRSLVGKIEKFLEYLKIQKEFKVEYILVGDTFCILEREVNE